MDYRTIAFYVSLVLIVGCLLEIYARKKEAVKVEKDSRGKVISNMRSIKGPLLLLAASVITAIATRLST
jgi:hypothetical protein